MPSINITKFATKTIKKYPNYAYVRYAETIDVMIILEGDHVGYVNGTKMCFDHDKTSKEEPKLLSDWFDSDRGKDAINYFENKYKNSIIINVINLDNEHNGIFIHYDMINLLATWLCIEYNFKIDNISKFYFEERDSQLIMSKLSVDAWCDDLVPLSAKKVNMLVDLCSEQQEAINSTSLTIKSLTDKGMKIKNDLEQSELEVIKLKKYIMRLENRVKSSSDFAITKKCSKHDNIRRN